MPTTKYLKDGEFCYNLQDKIGEGSFAEVFRGIICANKRVVAVRLLNTKLLKQYGDTIKQIIKSEAHVLKQISSINDPDSLFTTKIYDCFLTEHNIVMILEFCPDGSLDSFLKEKPLSEKEALPIILQIAKGLQFIARNKIVHRDIKPDNIFIKKVDNHYLFKLGDFGFALKEQLSSQQIGTPVFMSPEIFNSEKYSSEVDVWAFGLTVHYILFKEYYFFAPSQSKIKQKVCRDTYQLKPELRNKISNQMADFLAKCLQRNPKKRIQATEIANHPVFYPVLEKVSEMVKEVRINSDRYESSLRSSTAKGAILNIFSQHKFIFELAKDLLKENNYNYTALYLLKYNCGQLYWVRTQLKQKQNFINHQQWGSFVNSANYEGFLKLIIQLMEQSQKLYQPLAKTIIAKLKQKNGEEAANSMQNNLGGSTFDQINSKIIVHSLENDTIPYLVKQSKINGKGPSYFIGQKAILIDMILKNPNKYCFDFTFYAQTEQTMSIQERCNYIEGFLKNSMK